MCHPFFDGHPPSTRHPSRGTSNVHYSTKYSYVTARARRTRPVASTVLRSELALSWTGGACWSGATIRKRSYPIPSTTSYQHRRLPCRYVGTRASSILVLRDNSLLMNTVPQFDLGSVGRSVRSSRSTYALCISGCAEQSHVA